MSIEVDANPLLRGAPLAFTATVRDDADASTLDYAWGKSGVCPESTDPRTAAAALRGLPSVETASQRTFRTRHDGREPFCVWVIVRDRFGAEGAHSAMFTPRDRPPEGEIVVVEPAVAQTLAKADGYPLFSRFRVSGVDIKDGDPGDQVSVTWSIQGPDGSAVPPLKCSEPTDPKHLCFSADREGAYQVNAELVGSDGAPLIGPDGLKDVRTKTIVVQPDQPPCLTAFTPALTASPRPTVLNDEGVRFSVNVRDDGDPVPPSPDRGDSRATFIWTVKLGDEAPQRIPTGPNNSYAILPEFLRGQPSVEVTVEVHDRMHAGPFTCNASGTVCGVGLQAGAAGCLQRATWKLDLYQ